MALRWKIANFNRNFKETTDRKLSAFTNRKKRYVRTSKACRENNCKRRKAVPRKTIPGSSKKTGNLLWTFCYLELLRLALSEPDADQATFTSVGRSRYLIVTVYRWRTLLNTDSMAISQWGMKKQLNWTSGSPKVLVVFSAIRRRTALGIPFSTRVFWTNHVLTELLLYRNELRIHCTER